MKKAEQKTLLGAIQTEHCYEIAHDVVGFWCNNAEALFSSAMKMKTVMHRDEWEDFLSGVGVIYYSESYHKEKGNGWIYPANCLDLFFGERDIKDVDSWANLVDAIAYQQNVTAKTLRLSNICHTLARNEESAEMRAITCFIGTLLRKFSAQVFDNLSIIRDALGRETMASFEYWYRDAIKKQSLMFGMGEIHRVDAFLKHGLYFPDVKTEKYMAEKEKIQHAIGSLRVAIEVMRGGDTPAF